jgi:hypothetical protein
MMEKRYTAKVPASLAKRLYEVGMPLKVNSELEPDQFTGKVKKTTIIEPPSYAKTLDWLASKGFIVVVYPIHCLYCGAEERWATEFDIRVHNEHTHESECPDPMHDSFKTWHEAADYGIEKAIEML